MTRRLFFRSLALGSLATPGAMRAVSAPSTLTELSGHITGQTLYLRAHVLFRAGTTVRNCYLRLPWWRKSAWTGEAGRRSEIINNVIDAQPPRWARMVGLAPRVYGSGPLF